MKKILLLGLVLSFAFVACKKDDDKPDEIPTPLPTYPQGQYRLNKIEFRDSTNLLVETFIINPDSAQYFYYNLGQFTKAVTVTPTECLPTWQDFLSTVGFSTYDSTQFFGINNTMKMHFYLGWQTSGLGDPEFMYYYLSKTSYAQADTVNCN